MEKLRKYLNSLNRIEQYVFATRCGTSIGYMRKAISKEQKFSDGLCINIERESKGTIRCEDLRPDVDLAFLRC